MSKFTEPLIVSPLADGRTWVLREPFSYNAGSGANPDRIVVPERFMTDFTSVPRPLWAVLPKWGRYGNAAVIHDFLYAVQDRARHEADRVFLEAMTVLKVRWLTRTVLYVGVRVGGWWSWWRNGGVKKKGRYLKFAQRQPEQCWETARDIRMGGERHAEASAAA